VFLLLAAGAATSIESGAVTVSIQLAAAAAPAPRFEVVVRAVARQSSPATSRAAPGREIKLLAPGAENLELTTGLLWQVRAEAQGYWSEEQMVTPGTGTERVTLSLFPTGKLTAHVKPPPDGPAPKELSAGFMPAPQPGVRAAPKAAQGSVSCPIKQGLWECEVPAGALDLRLRAEGDVPVYRWGWRVVRGSTSDLGTIQLLRGSSVAGRVETAAGEAPPEPARVELLPQTVGAATSAATSQRLQSLGVEAATDKRGFFQFRGVTPGSYMLVVKASGFALARRAPILVREGLEAQLIDPIVLAPPLRLEVALDPAVDPYGKPWLIEVLEQRSAGQGSGDYLKGTASPLGQWSQSGVAPGDYLVRVGDDFGSKWVEEDFRLDAGHTLAAIRIPLVEVDGRLTVGDEPAAGTLWFGDRRDLRIRFDADQKGRFRGFLSKQGKWQVELEEKEARVRITLPPVEVTVTPGQRAAHVLVRVPDTRIAGTVVDQKGERVSGARVQMDQPGMTPAATETDERGEFELRGLPAGQTDVEGEKDGKTSDIVEVMLAERREQPGIQLVLRERREVHGTVVAAEGPVPGAQIMAWPGLALVGAATVEATVTGPDGGFSMTFPASATTLSLLILPPGYALRLLTISVDSRDPLEIPVDHGGGTLVLGQASGGPTPLLAHGGTFIVAPMLNRWISLQRVPPSKNGGLVVPNVEAGSYSLCVGASRALRSGQDPPSERCSSGLLAPGGELVLSPPPSAAGPNPL
jgi:hypothetical protein